MFSDQFIVDLLKTKIFSYFVKVLNNSRLK